MTGVVAAVLLGAAVLRTLLAGCPDGCGMPEYQCLFMPHDIDWPTHLISYVFLGAAGLATGTGYLLWRRQLHRVRRMVRNLARLRVPEDELLPLLRRLDLVGKVVLVDSSDPLCFCAGFRSPLIYVSRGTLATLTGEELEALLIHEKHHLENRVPLKILFGRCLTSAFFFIPYLRDLLQKYLVEAEIAADDHAIRRQGHAGGIIGAIEKLVTHPFTEASPGYAVGATGALSYRIDHLAGNDTGCSFACRFSHLAVSVFVTTLIVTAILHPLTASVPLVSGIPHLLLGFLG